jgi:predicted lipid-binding transport protein (Tim44 family)
VKSRDLHKDAPEVARAARWYLFFGMSGALVGGLLLGFVVMNERHLSLGSAYGGGTLGLLLLIAGVSYLLLSAAISLWRKFG